MKRIAMCLALAAGLLVNGIRVSGESTSAELFNDNVLQRVDINLHTQDWAKLKQDFRSNEIAPILPGMARRRNIGTRSRGGARAAALKPALKVDFNHYDAIFDSGLRKGARQPAAGSVRCTSVRCGLHR